MQTQIYLLGCRHCDVYNCCYFGCSYQLLALLDLMLIALNLQMRAVQHSWRQQLPLWWMRWGRSWSQSAHQRRAAMLMRCSRFQPRWPTLKLRTADASWQQCKHPALSALAQQPTTRDPVTSIPPTVHHATFVQLRRPPRLLVLLCNWSNRGNSALNCLVASVGALAMLKGQLTAPACPSKAQLRYCTETCRT
jgi:hypothetical protein